MPQLFSSPDPVSRPRAHGIGMRILGVAVAFVGLVLFLALVTYNWRDVSAQCAPAQSPPHNLAGYGGAWFAYIATLFLGLGAWTVPIWTVFSGVWMATGRRIAWRPVGMLLGTIAFMGFGAQLGEAIPSFAACYGPDHLNIGGYAGGVFGDLLVAQCLVPAMGGAATCCLLIAVLLAGIVVVIGVREVFDSLSAERAQGAQRLAGVQVDEADRDAAAEAAEDAHASLSGDEAKLAGLTAREAARRAREEEKERKRAEREAEKERKRQEREEEKARKQQEREDAKAAKLFERQQAEEAKAAEKAAEEEARQAEMRRRTEEFIERQRQEAAKAAAAAQPPAPPATELPEEPEEPETSESPQETAVQHIDYTLPSVGLLTPPPPKVEDDGAYTEECGRRIVETLAEFDVTVSLVGVHRGPVITQYHLLPAPGVRINKVTSYATDLQRALCAAQVRILAPIPGKGVIGVEVPNAKADIVAIREIADGEAWRARVAKSPLPLLLGKDIGGADYTADLASMPHLLIAGATGAGKSACINSLLAGLLLTRTPDELRLIMVDPKFVEFTPYANIPHLIVPIITEPKKVGVALQWAISEMNRRLKLFARAGARNIADYNRHPTQGELFANSLDGPDGKLPYVVIVIDELADLMLTAKNEIEGRISNLAAKARAAGIHMVIATQRPSVNVVTGVIKANFPGRIAFKVASSVDSLTILDAHGAEALLGRGDMLVHDPRVMGNTRVQGCWVSDEEVAAITNDLRAQGQPVYISSIKNRLDSIKEEEDEDGFDDGGGSGGASAPSGGSSGVDDGAPVDPNDDEALLRKALEIFRENRRASTSSLQRRLGLGYNRAARVLDKLQERGYIGPPSTNNGPREILVDLDELLDAPAEPSEESPQP